jgi:type VI secretion system ImpM family protein
MGFGLFGKLPQKRDFLSINLPHAVLNPFETWLQSAVAASRSEIGRNWENYYLVAPIWRFWLGKEILGTACTGSLMPSVDQVGRYFPLSIIYYAEPGESLTPPLVNPVEGWYHQIEQRLLAVLSENSQIDPSTLLAGLVPPDYSAPPPPRMPLPPPTPPPSGATPPPIEAAPPEPDVARPEAEVEAPVEAQPAPEDMSWLDSIGGPDQGTTPAPVAGADEDDSSRDQAGEAEAGALDAEADAEAGASVDEAWNPEPMPAERMAELEKISAVSFAPESVWTQLPEVRSLGTEKAADPSPVEEAAAAAAAPSPSIWDSSETQSAEAPAAEAETAEAASAEAYRASAAPGTPLGGTWLSSPGSADVHPMFDDGEEEQAFAEAPAGESAAPPAVPPPAPEAVAPPASPPPMADVQAGEFKGGLVALIEGGAAFADALPQLVALDSAHAAQGRSYWWCGPSSSGGPRLFAKQGLPDPYFFTRMLMWSDQ